ncbi:hypothetical protein D1BOALGB6SA_1147 [Olavius sp. associated proteobacterium Delta 1]|nr:hypothetical protein D1BOALGB6SA_1147 [Olavius sp. associated proteobacterium Delta 1]
MNADQSCYIQAPRINYFMLRIFLGFFIFNSFKLQTIG